MSHDRHRVQEDLRGVVAGEVLCSDAIAAIYSADAGPFSITPLGVVRPRNTQDVVQVVKYASENRISLHARGAATSSAALSLGPGLVLDFSRFMRRVVQEDESGREKCITVEPGAPIGRLERQLAKDNRTLGFAPFLDCVSTVGGIVARDAPGRYAGGFGRLAERMTACEVVLADGSVLELGRHRLEPDVSGSTPPRLQQVVRRVAALLLDNTSPCTTTTQSPNVWDFPDAVGSVLGAENIDLGRIFAGSGGTLGFVTRLTLQTLASPRHCGIVLLICSGLEQAAEAAVVAQRHGPSACDLLDRRHLTIVREADVRYEAEIPHWAEAALVVEMHADDEEILSQRLRAIVGEVKREVNETAATDVTTEAADLAFFRYLADAAPRLLHRIGGRKRPVAVADELILPVDKLATLIGAVQTLLQKSGVTGSVYANPSVGRLQLKLFLDLEDADDRQSVAPLCQSIAEIVWASGGVLGGNCACVLLCGSRFPQNESASLGTLRQIKRVFDPEDLFNPGKLLPAMPRAVDELLPPLRHVRIAASGREQVAQGAGDSSSGGANDLPAAHEATAGNNGEASPLMLLHPEFGWSSDEVHAAAAKCSGCGVCRAEHEVRMCPINHIAPREEASPRAKATLTLSVLRGIAGRQQTDESEIKKVADLCVHCHMCRLECPAQVDVPRLMAESKAQHVRTNGLHVSDWLMVHVDQVAAFSRRVRHMANWALGNRVARWILEKGAGIAQSRRLPMLERRSFLDEARRRRLTVPATGQEKVAFFVDTYVNHFDVELGVALVAVLEHNGVMVWVPPTQKQAGMPMISRGALEPARELARHNAAVLAEAVRQGYTIVATEPSAVLALTREYPALLPDDADVATVAGHTFEACHFLWQLHVRQQLRLEFKRLTATLGYHAPCHLLALGVGTPAENLLRLVPGLCVERLEYGCSGMAGTFGLQRKNYRKSLRMGLPLMTALRRMPVTAGATECSTCRMQMQHGTDRPTIHPIKVLALAYGLMPELRRHLFSGRRELTL
jgi:Fe-S oxidoreductase/FAD/FMN-containing dehydrogenase